MTLPLHSPPQPELDRDRQRRWSGANGAPESNARLPITPSTGSAFLPHIENRVTNPGAETGVTTWTGVTQSVVWAALGTKSFLASGTTGGAEQELRAQQDVEAFIASPGEWLSLATEVNVITASTDGLELGVTYFNQVGAAVAEFVPPSGPARKLGTGTVRLILGGLQVPNGVASASLFLRSLGPAEASEFLFDSVMAIGWPHIVPFFHPGSSPSYWTGTSEESASRLIATSNSPAPPADWSIANDSLGDYSDVTDADGLLSVVRYHASACLPATKEAVPTADAPPPTPSEYELAVLADNPAAYYRLGEPLGTQAADSSGNDNHGTYVGSISLGEAGLIDDPDAAVELNGSDVVAEYIAIAEGVLDLATATSIKTVECWISTTDTDAPLICLRDSLDAGNAVYNLVIGENGSGNSGTGRISILVRDSANGGLTSAAALSALNDGDPHHVVWTRNSSKLHKVYVDNVEVISVTDTMGAAITGDLARAGVEPLWLSLGQETENERHMNGIIDEIAIYDSVLSLARIQEHFEIGTAV